MMTRNSIATPASRRAPALLAALAAAAIAGSAGAATVTDPVGDFLTTYTGPHNGDMDVVSVSAFEDGTNLTLSAVLDGAIGTTAGGAYVFGIDRGDGAPLLTFGTPPVGTGVNFDAVAVLIPGGTSSVSLLVPSAAGPTPITDVTFSGSTFKAVIPLSMLPSNGLMPSQYLFNLWPRSGLVTSDNGQISDFAPDSSSFAASIPEPGAWAMMLLGFGGLGVVLRRRGRLALA